jgi:hypothetical protein
MRLPKEWRPCSLGQGYDAPLERMASLLSAPVRFLSGGEFTLFVWVAKDE